MSINIEAKVFIRALVCFVLVTAVVLLIACTVCPAEFERDVKFNLKVFNKAPQVFEVKLSFKLSRGENAVIKASEESNHHTGGIDEPVFELLPGAKPGYSIERSSPFYDEWVITAEKDGEVTVPYRVSFTSANSPESDEKASKSDVLHLPIATPQLKVFKGSQVFLYPSNTGGKPLSVDFKVSLDIAGGEKPLVPWESDGDDNGNSFHVNGISNLLENYVAWGRIDELALKYGKTDLRVGFLKGEQVLSKKERDEYAGGISSIMDEISRVLGARPELNRLSILVADAEQFQMSNPWSGTLRDSVLILRRGKKLEGRAAAAAAQGLFELWNRWSMVPAEDGDALWFQYGLPLFYRYRIATQAGLLRPSSAYGYFTGVYTSYITDPLARTASLSDAEKNGEIKLLSSKGAVVCASVDQRLIDQTDGDKDIDWLLGELSMKANHFEGRDYTAVDIEELLEEATKKSWSRFFADKVGGTGLISASEFSTTDLFGAPPGSGRGKELDVKGSGTSWVILAVAAVAVFLIPIIFGAYVRGAVKLDLTMPKIIPEDDET